MSTSENYYSEEEFANPLDIAEEFGNFADLPIARTGDQELIVTLPGQWASHHLSLLWHHQQYALNISCVMDLRVTTETRAAVDKLLSLVNQKIWIGHFEVCPDAKCITFRQTLLLRGQQGISEEQLEDAFEITLEQVDRFFPTFHFVLFDGKSPEEAIIASMLETVGEA